MTGTLINAAAVIAGSLLGLLLKRFINPSLEHIVQIALGLSTMFIGINGVVCNMITVGEGGKLSSSGELLLIFSLVLGVLAGELLRIDDHLNGLGGLVERRFHLTGFSAGLVNATLLFCVGTMAIIGPLNDGLTGDDSILLVKSTLDFISSIVLTAGMGVGVLFSFLPLLLYQGLIALAAGALSTVLAGELLVQICMVGYVLIFCIGLNFLWPGKIKTANFLPALLVPVVWSLLQRLWS